MTVRLSRQLGREYSINGGFYGSRPLPLTGTKYALLTVSNSKFQVILTRNGKEFTVVESFRDREQAERYIEAANAFR